MDLKTVIRERRTIQNFSTDKVPDSAVLEALELSLWAPNHRLTFPWVYIIVDRAKREQLADLAIELKAKKGEVSEASRTGIRSTFLNPSHMVMIGVKPDPDAGKDKENFATLACSVQIASMVLWENSIGVKWSTTSATTHPKTYEILGVSSSQVRFEGCLFIGKPAMVPPGKDRPPLAEVIQG